MTIKVRANRLCHGVAVAVGTVLQYGLGNLKLSLGRTMHGGSLKSQAVTFQHGWLHHARPPNSCFTTINNAKKFAQPCQTWHWTGNLAGQRTRVRSHASSKVKGDEDHVGSSGDGARGISPQPTQLKSSRSGVVTERMTAQILCFLLDCSGKAGMSIVMQGPLSRVWCKQ